MINRKRIFKITGITIVVIILLTLAGSFLFSYLAKKKIKGAQIGNFQLESEKINTNLFRRQIRFSNAKLTTENSRNNAVIPEARLSGIKLLHLIFSNEVVIKKFKISGPTINFYKKDESKSSGNPPPPEKKTGKKKVILIHHLEISKFQFHFLDEGKNKPDTVFSTLLDFNVWELNTDSASHGYSNKKFGFSRAKLFAEKGNFKTSNGLFNLQFDKMGFDTEDPNLIISRLEFNSPYGKYELGQQTGVETNWYDISIDSIQLNHFDVAALIKDTAIIFGNSSIKNIDAEIFRDKHLPFPDKKDTKLPAAMIKSIPLPFHNDSLIIENANIKYETRGEKAEKAGMVSFNSLNATLRNISNIDSLRNGPATLSAQAEVMGEATLNADFTFAPAGSQEQSQVSGTLEPTEFAIFNPILKPYVGVNVQSGQVIQLAFNYGFNNERADGDLIFQYKNLDFVMLDKKDDSKKLVLTFLANELVIRENNIDSNDSYRKGEIAYERNKKKGAFNFWWKAILNGIKDVAVVL